VLSTAERKIVDLTNQQRAQNGLPALTVNTKLVQMADIHSQDMARLHHLEHTLSGVAQPTLADRAKFVGYSYWALGENVASGYPDASSVTAGWMASSGHRANILNSSYTQIGVAIANDNTGVPYYTVVFGKPA
jgi:uncharacterized protein YkwD